MKNRVGLWGLSHMWNWLRNSSARTTRKPIDKATVSWTADDFVVLWPEKKLEMKWSDVAVVRAWKEDYLAYDMIVLGFFDNESRGVGVEEETEHFAEFVDAARKYLPGFNWWDHFNTVAFPAFQANLTTIWTRQDNTSTT